MSRLVKDMITRQLRERYGRLDSALWLELTGLDGILTNQFRRDLRARNMRMEVVKNSLFRRAIGDGPLKPLADALAGPAAILTGGDSLIDVAKLVEEWLPKAPGIRLRGAVIEGQWLDESRVGQLSKLPTKRDLQARVAALVLTPAARLAGTILSPGAGLAGALRALVEKLEEGGTVVRRSA